MKKAICLVLISILITISAVPAFAQNSDYTVSTFKELSDAISAIGSGDKVTINVLNDITFEDTLYIEESCTINFTGPGNFHVDKIRAFYVYEDYVNLFFNGKKIYDGSWHLDCAYDGEAFVFNSFGGVIDGAVFESLGSSYINSLSFEYGWLDQFYDRCGGAIWIDSEQTTIQNCTFINCRAQSCGGAIFIDNDDVRIYNCTFDNCISRYDGGAIYLNWGCSEVVIEDCTFKNCIANAGNHGSVGPNVYGRDDTEVVNCKSYSETGQLASEAENETLYPRCVFPSVATKYWGTMFSDGNIWMIICIAEAAVAVAVIFIISKKKASSK